MGLYAMVVGYVNAVGRHLLMRLSRRLSIPQAGQSMVEYAIVVALIAIVAMVAVEGLGTGIADVFDSIVDELTSLGSGSE